MTIDAPAAMLHRQHERVGVQHFADDDARDDPADRSEHANDRKVARRNRVTWWNEIEFVSDSVGM